MYVSQNKNRLMLDVFSTVLTLSPNPFNVHTLRAGNAAKQCIINRSYHDPAAYFVCKSSK